MAAHLNRHPGEVSILALGPLTNLASALRERGDLGAAARRVTWMGGTLDERGNTTDTGEWNACVDPEAAEACLRSGAIHELFPLDATQDVVFTMEDMERLPKTRLGSVVTQAVRFYVEFHRSQEGLEGAYLHDPVTLIASLLRPDLVTAATDERLACDTSPDIYVAGTLRRVDDGRRAVRVATAIDAEAMHGELLDRLGRAVMAGAD